MHDPFVHGDRATELRHGRRAFRRVLPHVGLSFGKYVPSVERGSDDVLPTMPLDPCMMGQKREHPPVEEGVGQVDKNAHAAMSRGSRFGVSSPCQQDSAKHASRAEKHGAVRVPTPQSHPLGPPSVPHSKPALKVPGLHDHGVATRLREVDIIYDPELCEVG
ncbi:hypothetical protein DYB28_005658 [Aphanomyces astaci]|uniref:Uncharacterized protein n=1 Tax=Aphanomyces astaci TaxID=112090 RepID=A0A397AGU9_APHAT|nr:hypothetical protein DYB36_005575 [Aphanomyces astaci]RHY22461.1 hypothetical protein DYB25_001129 [Aphanomyces astaci]RHY52760.1 hypothetical protein DYB34_005287 [Aphanomyces astaci]RHY58420.1 hypothetical protein DYB38_000690 [Aphanomyces astaci]RHY71950.1 hypothetical protein DYB30_008995 [Aphanomyces astaci]